MTRLAPLAAALSIFGLLAWLVLSRVQAPAPDGDSVRLVERPAGSTAPCSERLGWRMGRVDPGFEVDVDEARAAVVEAVSLWEEAADRPLFTHDPEDGFPIRLVHDERQVRAEERRRREAELAAERRRLEARSRELSARREELAAARDDHDHRVRELRSRLSEYNADVRRTNEGGAATEEAIDELRRSEEALRRERRQLEEERRSLADRERQLRHEEERLERLIDAYERRAEDVEREFPSAPVEAGAYREAVREEGAGEVPIRREIRVYRFTSRDDLVRVLAHELGHAQGLGHTATPGSLMSERYGDRESAGPPALAPADLELLRERCSGS